MDAAEIKIHGTLHPSSLSFLHPFPVLERVIHQGLWGHSDDGIIEITYLHRSERHLFHDTVGTSFRYGNPIAFMQHVVTGKTDARNKSFDGVLEHKHQNGRRSTQSCKQFHRVFIDDDRYDDDGSHEDHQQAQYADERIEVLLFVAALLAFQILDGGDEYEDRLHRHHHDIDGGDAG